MNIFVLDLDPYKAAEYHNDSHCCKMLLEGVQLLSTAYRIKHGDRVCDDLSLYKITHTNHPCSKWVRESEGNFKWLWELADGLSSQYTERFGKIHKSSLLLNKFSIDEGEMTPFALTMPDQYKSIDPVKSYRDYYKGEKQHLAKWRNGKPEWWRC